MIPLIDRCRLALLLTVLSVAAPVSAQCYTATQQGEVVTLTARAADTVVSVAPSRGNMATAMRVKGHEVLEARGIPFMAPWANRLDERRSMPTDGVMRST